MTRVLISLALSLPYRARDFWSSAPVASLTFFFAVASSSYKVISFVKASTSSGLIFFFQAEDGIRDAQESRGLGDVYKRQETDRSLVEIFGSRLSIAFD